jgi:hypothetical protein
MADFLRRTFTKQRKEQDHRASSAEELACTRAREKGWI